MTVVLYSAPAHLSRFLATVGRRSTNQAVERREDERKYPILLTLVAQSAVDQLDEVVTLLDQAVSARESRAKVKTDATLAERGKRGEVRQALLEMILPVLADPGIPDERVGGLLRGQIGMGVLRVHPGAMGAAAGRVLRTGRQTRRRPARPGAGCGGVARRGGAGTTSSSRSRCGA